MLDSDILMSDSLISAHLGQTGKYGIHLDRLTHIYFENIQFENNHQSMLNIVSENKMVFNNSQLVNHTGNFINIETHSSGAYFTLLSNINFTDLLADEGSFIAIENKNVLNQSIRFENIVFANKSVKSLRCHKRVI